MKFLRNIVIVFGLLMQCFSAAIGVDYICSSEISIAGVIRRTEISPDGKMLAIFSDTEKLTFYNQQDFCWVENASLEVSGINSYLLSPDWEVLAVIKKNGSLELYTRDNDCWRKDLCIDHVKSYQFSPREQAIIILTSNDQLQRYNYLQNGSWVRDSLFLVENVDSFELFFDFFVVITLDSSLKIYKYDYEILYLYLEINTPTSYTFSFDEQYFLVFKHDDNFIGQLIIYIQESDSFAHMLMIDDVMDYQFSPDEQTISVLHENHQLALYENVNGGWTQNPNTINDVDQCIFSPDGKSFVVKINPLVSEKPLIVLYIKSNGDLISNLEIGGLSGQIFFYNNQEFGVYQQNKKIALISKQGVAWCKALELDNVLSYLPPKELLFPCSIGGDKLCLFENRDGQFVESFIIEIKNIQNIQSFVQGKSDKDLMVITHPDEQGLSKLITLTQRASRKSSRATISTSTDFQEQDLNNVETAVFENLKKRDLRMRTRDTKTRGQKPSRKRRFLELLAEPQS